MDLEKLVAALRATLDPVERKNAEQHLEDVRKIVGFAPGLLRIIVSNELEMPVRQSAAIYFKNKVGCYWHESEPEPGEPMPFSFHEQDKSLIRASLVDAMIHAPPILALQLGIALKIIVREDFTTGKWPELPLQIHQLSNSPDKNIWAGYFAVLQQVVKVYEYKQKKDRQMLNELLKPLFADLTARASQLVQDNGPEAHALLKALLKLFFTLIQFHLPLELLSYDDIGIWLKVALQRLRVLPPVEFRVIGEDTDKDDLVESVYWKCRKWAIYILHRVSSRYGVVPAKSKSKKKKKKSTPLEEFALWYLKNFTGQVIDVLMSSIFGSYAQGEFVAPRVMQQAFGYIREAVNQAFSWKILKPFVVEEPNTPSTQTAFLIPKVVFPVMCLSAEDEQLWEEDPQEFIRIKYDFLEDMNSASGGAESFMQNATEKRHLVLQQAMEFCVRILNECQPNVPCADRNLAKQKDGALKLIGCVHRALQNRAGYKERLEELISHFVLPEFRSEFGFMRARACFIVKQFSTMEFQCVQTAAPDGSVALRYPVFEQAVEGCLMCLGPNEQLPVRVEATTAVNELISDQDDLRSSLEPLVPEILKQLLDLLQKSSAEDIVDCMQTLVNCYEEKVKPLAVDLTRELCKASMPLLDKLIASEQAVENLAVSITADADDDDADANIVTINGLLDTMSTLLEQVSDSAETEAEIEPLVIPISCKILQNEQYAFFEEAFELARLCTLTRISEDMWSYFQIVLLAHCFPKDDIFDYYTDLLPILHNYIVRGGERLFMSPREGQPTYLQSILELCKSMIESKESNDECEMHAAKLFEVLFVQYQAAGDQLRQQINGVMEPIFKVVFDRFSRDIATSELRQMLMQVILAGLYYDRDLALQTLRSLSAQVGPVPSANPWSTSGGQQSLLDHFITLYIRDSDVFLGIHDRRMFLIGTCLLLETPPDQRPAEINNIAGEIVPSCILIFEGLERAYRTRAEEAQSESDEDETDETPSALNGGREDADELDSDEDDQETDEYLRFLAKASSSRAADELVGAEDDDDSDTDSYDSLDGNWVDCETQLEETYDTILDDEKDSPVDEYIFFKRTMQRIETTEPQLFHSMTGHLSPEQQKQLLEVVKEADRRIAMKHSEQLNQSGGFAFSGGDLTVPPSFNFNS